MISAFCEGITAICEEITAVCEGDGFHHIKDSLVDEVSIKIGTAKKRRKICSIRLLLVHLQPINEIKEQAFMKYNHNKGKDIIVGGVATYMERAKAANVNLLI